MTTDPRYEALLTRLYAARRSGIVLGLERVREVLAKLGSPEQRLGAIAHIAGTNGKGSTATMVEAIARAAGRRTALYTSPHLASLRERFAIDGLPASEAAVVAAGEAVAAAGGDALTFFEQVTAMAFVLFAEAGVEVAVIEVGLGGRLDATNVLDAPVAAVTGVAMDHQAMLGDTLAAIAAEKAGIFKPGQQVIVGRSGEDAAVPWLVDAARAAGAANVRVIEPREIAAAPPTALAGPHQRANAACALAIADALQSLGAFDAPRAVRAAALASVRHPGRFETIAGSPRLILDGAHNPHGAAALAAAVAALPGRPRILVLAVSSDKDVGAMIAPLAAPGLFERAIATRYDQPRALDPAALAAALDAAGLAAEPIVSLPLAVDRARALAGPEGVVVVAGSLFAVGEVRPDYIAMPVDPLVVTDPAP